MTEMQINFNDAYIVLSNGTDKEINISSLSEVNI
jgi:hypothetical protein